MRSALPVDAAESMAKVAVASGMIEGSESTMIALHLTLAVTELVRSTADSSLIPRLCNTMAQHVASAITSSDWRGAASSLAVLCRLVASGISLQII